MPENPLQTFGKALGGLGAGLQGRPNPFMEQDLARERMAQQERQFGQTLDLQKQQHAAQLEQIRANLGMEGIKVMPILQNMIEGLPEDRREEAVKQWTPFVSRFFSFAMQGNPEGQALASPAHVTELLRPGEYGKNFLKEYPFLADRPTDRAMVSKMVREGKYAEARTYLKEAAASVKETTLQGVYGKVRAGASRFAAPIPFADAVKVAGLTPLEQTVMDEAIKDADPTKLDQLLTTMNIQPLGPVRERAGIPVAAEKAGAIKAAQDITPGGQAELARTKAQTEEAQARTAEIRGGKVVPFQEGGGIAVVKPGGKVEIVQATGPKPVPLSATERNALTEEQALADQLVSIGRQYQPAYVGLVTGRVHGKLEPIGGLSGEESKFRASVQELRNKTLRMMSGAAVTPSESTRIEGQLPGVNNAPSVFEARLEQTSHNIAMLMQRRREILKGTGADVSKLPAIPVIKFEGQFGPGKRVPGG